MEKPIIKWIFLAGCIIFSACTTQLPVSGTPDANPTSVTALPKTLTICLGEEPDSLYLYTANNLAAQLMLQAIYDGPIDFENGQPKAVILERIPDQEHGDISVQSIEVNNGDAIINTAGDLVALQPGVQIFPTGCTSPSCAVIWDGKFQASMDQLIVRYWLKSGLNWSDGQPLMAEDSVYSFTVASDPATPGSKQAIKQTASYKAIDDLTLQWVSKPGLATDAFEKYFWMPLPEHAWKQYSVAGLPDVEAINREPLGWGAYRVDKWIGNESIRLVRNPYYFRTAEGLPYFDTLIFKIINPYGDTALSNLKFERGPYQQFNFDVGEFDAEIFENGCDLTTSTSNMRDQLPVLNILLNYFQSPAIKTFKSADESTDFLVFNIRDTHSSAENALNALPVREAISLCLDREKAIKELSFGLYDLPGAMFAKNNGKNAQNKQPIIFNPARAAALLEGAGWKDQDNQAKTPRVARGISGIPDGTELGFSYFVEAGGDNIQAAEIFKASLATCGIGINIKAVPTEIYWDASHADSIFQGQYDLAQITWATPLADACLLFSSPFIPSTANEYLGTNFSGYSNADFDNTCMQLRTTHLRSERDFLTSKMEAAIDEAIPMVPLYSYSRLIAAQKDFCDNGLSSGFRNELAEIELFKISPDCQ